MEKFAGESSDSPERPDGKQDISTSGDFKVEVFIYYQKMFQYIASCMELAEQQT
jgi:hypothetical protein